MRIRATLRWRGARRLPRPPAGPAAGSRHESAVGLGRLRGQADHPKRSSLKPLQYSAHAGQASPAQNFRMKPEVLTSERIENVLRTLPRLTIGLVGDLFLDRYLECVPGSHELSIETG